MVCLDGKMHATQTHDTWKIPVAITYFVYIYTYTHTHSNRNGMCFRYTLDGICRMFCNATHSWWCFSWRCWRCCLYFYRCCSCCYYCCCCLLRDVVLIAVGANLKYSGECVSSSWKTFSMEFSLFNGAFSLVLPQKQLFEICLGRRIKKNRHKHT